MRHNDWLFRITIVMVVVIAAMCISSNARASKCDTSYGGISETITEYQLCREYAVGYDSDLKTPMWVAYRVSASTLIKKVRRHGSFASDHRLQKKDRIYSSRYTRTGYDRGHMAPAINFRYSKKAEKNAFIMSNIVPQLPRVNRGIWKALEYRIQKTALRDGELLVIDGPIYSLPIAKLKGIVPIPSSFYKIIVRESPLKVAAFIIPNINPPKKYNLADYAVSVDNIEAIVGIDFLANTPLQIQNSIENIVPSASDWPLIIK